MGFKEIALPLAQLGIPTTPVRPQSKAAFLQDWQKTCTTDPQQILLWDAMYPGHNAAAIAKAELGGVWFLEVDSKDVIQRIEQETGQRIPDTYRVRSRASRGHFYWSQTPASIVMGNITQTAVKFADWSARVKNEYVVAAGSVHPDTGLPYEKLTDDPIIPAPDWLVNWCLSQKISQVNPVLVNKETGLVQHGSIHGFLLHNAGKLRAAGMDADEIEPVLLRMTHQYCAPPIDESKVKAMAKSICNFPAGTPAIVLTGSFTEPVQPVPAEALPTFEQSLYPKWPEFVMKGTSIYENFVKPWCATNSRYDYFLWIPAMIMMLNYLGTKIQVADLTGVSTEAYKFRTGLYAIMIGRKGKVIKSSSVEDGMSYFEQCGLLQHSGRDTRNAEGKTLVYTAGSPEGLGIDMQTTNCKNGLLYYDELSKLVNKASIDASSLVSDLLTLYEAGKFQNKVKSRKETYNLAPDTYCVSLIACTTDKKFSSQWSKLGGQDSGLNDRTFFVYQPEQLKDPTPYVHVNTNIGSVETRKRVDKAIKRGVLSFVDRSPLTEIYKIDNRYGHKAEKWAVALAVDLGRDEIDEECIERAKAIIAYDISVRNYLKTYEATSKEGQLQQEILRLIQNAGGRMCKRDLERSIKPIRHGVSVWEKVYTGLLRAGWMREEGLGDSTSPKYIQLLRVPERDDEE